MPKIKAYNLTLNYEQQGSGEPLILIPYLSADHACYAFQVAEYSRHFTCISLDLRGTGESDSPRGDYTTETLADDVAAFMHAMGLQSAHIAGQSLGAGIGLWLAVKHPDKVKSLSLHGGWPKTDAFLKPVLETWQVVAKALNNVHEMAILSIFPWCLTPDLYVSKPDYIEALASFVRSRPAPSVEAFLEQSDAVKTHDIAAQMSRIEAPTLITVGRYDMLTPTRVASDMKQALRNSEMLIFEGCAHAALYQNVADFNQKTLAFLMRQVGASAAVGRSA
jgi:pimeloyl-ACP methyl ester carboxylesterase